MISSSVSIQNKEFFLYRQVYKETIKDI